VVEADERLDDDEAALGKPRPVLGHAHGRLEFRHVVVREVADDRRRKRLRLLQADEPRTPADERVAAETPTLDGLEEEAAAAVPAQAKVRPERGEEIGWYGLERCHRKTKKASAEALLRDGVVGARLAQAPASQPVPRRARMRRGSHRA
jgi:hypothetical protein